MECIFAQMFVYCHLLSACQSLIRKRYNFIPYTIVFDLPCNNPVICHVFLLLRGEFSNHIDTAVGATSCSCSYITLVISSSTGPRKFGEEPSFYIDKADWGQGSSNSFEASRISWAAPAVSSRSWPKSRPQVSNILLHLEMLFVIWSLG